MTTVLACIDNSVAARPVLEFARILAPLFDATVQAVSVLEDGDATVRAEAGAEEVPLVPLRGEVIDALTTRARDADVVAVVVGARDHPSGHRSTGHVPRALADRVDAPVLVVPPEFAPTGRVTRVLVAMKGTREHELSLKRAIALAAGADLEVVVLHVDDEKTVPSFSDQVQHEAGAYAHEFFARYVPDVPKARLELRVGVPADEILHATETIHPDLVAVGWRQGSDAEQHDVAREVLDRSPLPVLLVALA